MADINDLPSSEEAKSILNASSSREDGRVSSTPVLRQGGTTNRTGEHKGTTNAEPESGVLTQPPMYRKVDITAMLNEPRKATPWRCEGIVADGTLTVLAGTAGDREDVGRSRAGGWG